LDKLVKFYAGDPVAQKKASQEAAEQEVSVVCCIAILLTDAL
jgi:hypothetical protein